MILQGKESRIEVKNNYKADVKIDFEVSGTDLFPGVSPGRLQRAFLAVLGASWRPSRCPVPAFGLLLDAFCTFFQAFSAMSNCQLDRSIFSQALRAMSDCQLDKEPHHNSGEGGGGSLHVCLYIHRYFSVDIYLHICISLYNGDSKARAM